MRRRRADRREPGRAPRCPPYALLSDPGGPTRHGPDRRARKFKSCPATDQGLGPVLTGFFIPCRIVLDVGRRKRQPCLDETREDARADRKDVVVEYEVGVMDGRCPLVAEPEIGPGLRLQHIGEILTAGLWARRRRHVLGAA